MKKILLVTLSDDAVLSTFFGGAAVPRRLPRSQNPGVRLAWSVFPARLTGAQSQVCQLPGR